MTRIGLDSAENGIGGDGITLVGRTVAVNDYDASYEVESYRNLTRITVRETYHFLGTDTPLMEVEAQAHSVLIATTTSGVREFILLGNFETRNLAYPNILSNRETPIDFWGKENSPTSIHLEIRISADGVGTQQDIFTFDSPTVLSP